MKRNREVLWYFFLFIFCDFQNGRFYIFFIIYLRNSVKFQNLQSHYDPKKSCKQSWIPKDINYVKLPFSCMWSMFLFIVCLYRKKKKCILHPRFEVPIYHNFKVLFWSFFYIILDDFLISREFNIIKKGFNLLSKVKDLTKWIVDKKIKKKLWRIFNFMVLTMICSI